MAHDLLFHFIRHGESTDNVRPDLFGTIEAELTDRGEQQCHLLGVRLVNEGIQPCRFLASPLPRAAASAEILMRKIYVLTGRQIPLGFDNSLVEHRNGDWGGKPIAEITTPEILAQMRRQGMRFAPPNGESLWMVEQRMTYWFQQNVTNMPPWPDVTHPIHFIIVSHGTAIRCLLRRIMSSNWRFMWAMAIPNASITTIRLTEGEWCIDRIGDIQHLPLSY